MYTYKYIRLRSIHGIILEMLDARVGSSELLAFIGGEDW